MDNHKIIDIKNLIRAPGIYIWKHKNLFMYIGQSSNLLFRISALDHGALQFFDPEVADNSLNLYIIRDKQRRLRLESKLIQRYKPVLNSIKPNGNELEDRFIENMKRRIAMNIAKRPFIGRPRKVK